MLVVDADSECELRDLSPDFGRLASLDSQGVLVTARSDDPRYDFVSRYFAPAIGVNEDPVTGAARCCLAPLWGGRLGKTKMVGRQLSARGGIVHIEVRHDRRLLGGEGFIFAGGESSAPGAPSRAG